ESVAEVRQAEPIATDPSISSTVGQITNRSDSEFADFPAKQRTLLITLRSHTLVPMAALKQAVYGTEQVATDTLEQLITRTNRGLTDRKLPLEIKRKANTFRLAPV